MDADIKEVELRVDSARFYNSKREVFSSMESKRGQKLSKATVATVLAASGVIVAMPQPSHAYSFEDLNPLADYYEPVLDLANRKIATGYSDGTFKPNQAITREDAAKMLALTIDVNITNPKNPGFKDVTTSNPNYRYIAALAELGIINGYSDKTFKPKEPITRGQMAKILTLGFKFGVSTKLNHGFKDVSNKNANAYFIQTLYDLNVTKGKTPIAFDPFNTVTRGQMATFIWRAEKADRGNPVYAVGDVIGDQIYINGVPHTIASHLRSILNAANKNILKDAQIEGDFSGNRINNISKLTINASGTSSRLLAMDGNYTSFSGELVVNGSYVRFKNITFTGRVEVAEAPRRSLADLSNMRVASVGNFAQFIDWSKPTVEKNEDFLNPIDKENLVEKPDPTKPNSTYKDRMANLKKYVDFEGSDIRHLYVTAERTFLKADYEIDRLYVQGNVANFELYASPNAMYIDTDYNVNIYGVHDIRYVYKNTLKNVHLRSDATYDNYYITSSNGFTNIGEHTYITNTIIPPNKTVNDVFDDFETDEPQIGHIEDENGKEVSRDPVGDTVIKDVTAPRITDLRVSAGGTLADVSLTADEDGTYYYVVKRADEKAPTINEIKTGGTKHSGNGPIVMDEPVKFQVTGLDTKIDYVIYAIVIDAADNVSEKEKAEFSTVDNKPPTLSLTKGEVKPGGKRFEFIVKNISEPGRVYYYVRQKGSSAVDPTVDEIIKNPTGEKLVTTPSDLPVEVREIGAKPNMSSVLPSTEYEIFAVMVDSTGNKMRVVEKIMIKTEAPDEANPFVSSEELVLDDGEKGYFYITVSEELDKKTAENPDNYLLSGTGIVNISGHKEMKPVEVVYSKKRIRLTIPSVSSLVNGDTIVATVLKGVQDLAENEFENKDTVPLEFKPRNYAQYNHTDAVSPKLDIKNVITGPGKYEIEVNTNKAGTYYYMILPKDYDFSDITNRDFVDEFSKISEEITGKFQVTTPLGKTDAYIASGQNPAALGTFKFDVTQPGIPPRDPFKTYNIYMVLKDRSGKLSPIINKGLIDDSKPPLVASYSIKNLPSTDDRIEFTANVDEKANFHVLPVKKYKKTVVDGVTTYTLNTDYFDESGNLKDITDVLSMTPQTPDLFEKFKALGAKDIGGSEGQGTIIKTPNAGVLNLEAHEEYGFYIGAVDTIGNFTILQRSSATSLDQDEPKGAQMKTTLYMDGTKPEIANDQVIVRKGELTDGNPEFTITFSEAIMRQSDESGIANYNKSLIPSTGPFNLSSIFEFEGTDIGKYEFVRYTVGTSTTSESKLVIRAKDPSVAQQTFQVKMKEDATGATVYDYKNKNGFDTSKIGKYIYPATIDSVIKGATLTGINIGLAAPAAASKTTRVLAYLDIDLQADQTYYYAVTANRPSVDPQLVLSLISNPNTPNNDILVYGSGKLETTNAANKQFTLDLTAPAGVAGSSPVFTQNNHIHLFTIDKYGNIVWAKDETTNQVFSIIKNDFNIPFN